MAAPVCEPVCGAVVASSAISTSPLPVASMMSTILGRPSLVTLSPGAPGSAEGTPARTRDHTDAGAQHRATHVRRVDRTNAGVQDGHHDAPAVVLRVLRQEGVHLRTRGRTHTATDTDTERVATGGKRPIRGARQRPRVARQGDTPAKRSENDTIHRGSGENPPVGREGVPNTTARAHFKFPRSGNALLGGRTAQRDEHAIGCRKEGRQADDHSAMGRPCGDANRQATPPCRPTPVATLSRPPIGAKFACRRRSGVYTPSAQLPTAARGRR